MIQNPFYFGGKIVNPDQFVGREEAIRFILLRMTGVQMASIPIVGERRIGKSSLLYHIYQTYAQRVDDPERFLVAFVSLQDAKVRTRIGFVQSVSHELQRIARAHPKATIMQPWRACTDMVDLGEQLRTLKDVGLRVIVCMDEFEEFLEQKSEFDGTFFDSLRAWLDDQRIMLVIASAHPLTHYDSAKRKVSRLFNLTNSYTLREWNDAEANVLLSRSITEDNGRVRELGVTDRELVKSLGKFHPFFLQMAAHFAFEAMLAGKSTDWVRHQFYEQAEPHQPRTIRFLQKIRKRTLRCVAGLGQLARRTGETQDEFMNLLTGVAIIIILLLLTLGVVAPSWVKPLVEQIPFMGGGE